MHFKISELKAPAIISLDAIKFTGDYYPEFSNYHILPIPIVDEYGLSYQTLEHYYQSRKSVNPKDYFPFAIESGANYTPNKAKKKGKLLEVNLQF